jgi:hypothetical protein
MSQQAKLSLSTKDVIHIEGFQENASLFKNESTLRIRTILQQLQAACTASGMGLAEVNALMEQGIPCEVLQPGAADWQMGSIRLSLEFQPGIPSAAPMASTVTMQSSTLPSNTLPSNAVVSAPAAAAVIASAPVAAVAVATAASQMDLEMDSMDDFSMESDLDADLESDASLDSELIGDLDDTFGEDLDMGGLDDSSLNSDALSGMMPDASLEESVNSDLDLSGLSDMDSFDAGLSDGFGEGDDDLAFDLDSQAVDAGDLGELGDLSSPWDLSDDLDEMLLTNGSL